MKNLNLKQFVTFLFYPVIFSIFSGCGNRPKEPAYNIKPAVYDMEQGQTLTLDQPRGATSFTSAEAMESSQTDDNHHLSTPAPISTEAFDVFPDNAILNYNPDGSFNFTPPQDFNGIARFKIRWPESALEKTAQNPKLYPNGKVPVYGRLRVSLRRASPGNLRDWYIVDHNQPFEDVWTDVIIFVDGNSAPQQANNGLGNKRPLFNEELWNNRSRVYSAYIKHDSGAKYGIPVVRQFFKAKFYLDEQQFLLESFSEPNRYAISQPSLVFNDYLDIDDSSSRAQQIRSSGLILEKYLYNQASANLAWKDGNLGGYPLFDVTLESDIYEHADEDTKVQIDFLNQLQNPNFYKSDSGLVHTKIGPFYPGIFPIPNLDYAAIVDTTLPGHAGLNDRPMYHYIAFNGSDTFTLSSYLEGVDFEWMDFSQDLEFELLDDELEADVFQTQVLSQSGFLRGLPFEKAKALLSFSDDYNTCYVDIAFDSMDLIGDEVVESIVTDLVDKGVSYVTDDNNVLVHRIGPFHTLHSYENYETRETNEDGNEVLTTLLNYSRESMTLQMGLTNPEVEEGNTSMVFNDIYREGFWAYSQTVSSASGVWNGFYYYNSEFNAEFSENFDTVDASVTFDVLEHVDGDDELKIIEWIEADDQLEFSEEDGFVTWHLSSLQSNLDGLNPRFYKYEDFFGDLDDNPAGASEGVHLQSVRLEGGSLYFSFHTEEGVEYLIEWANKIDTPTWEIVGFEEGTGDIATLQADISASSEGYVRVKKVLEPTENLQ